MNKYLITKCIDTLSIGFLVGYASYIANWLDTVIYVLIIMLYTVNIINRIMNIMLFAGHSELHTIWLSRKLWEFRYTIEDISLVFLSKTSYIDIILGIVLGYVMFMNNYMIPMYLIIIYSILSVILGVVVETTFKNNTKYLYD